jgi:transketolase
MTRSFLGIENFSYKNPREGIKEALEILGKREPKVVVLSGDLANSTKVDEFKKKYPERYIECGIAEQNMIAVAAGLAAEGFIPLVADFAAFVPPRCLDQIRLQLGIGRANVKLISTHAGLNVGADGASHQMLEDIAILKAIPGINIIAPATASETKEAILAAVKLKGPFYIRIARADLPEIAPLDFQFGKAKLLKEGSEVSLFVTGALLSEALAATKEAFFDLKIDVELIHMPTIKPLDEVTILNSARKTGRVLTVEEAQASGGFGESILTVLARFEEKIKFSRIAVFDSFGTSGEPKELWHHFRLDKEAILEAIEELVD